MFKHNDYHKRYYPHQYPNHKQKYQNYKNYKNNHYSHNSNSYSSSSSSASRQPSLSAPLQSYKESVARSMQQSAQSMQSSIANNYKASMAQQSERSIVTSLKASITASLQNTSEYSMVQQQKHLIASQHAHWQLISSLDSNTDPTSASQIISNTTSSLSNWYSNSFKPNSYTLSTYHQAKQKSMAKVPLNKRDKNTIKTIRVDKNMLDKTRANQSSMASLVTRYTTNNTYSRNFANELTPDMANRLKASYAVKTNKRASMMNPTKSYQMKSMAKNYQKAMSAKKKHRYKSWMKKSITPYLSAKATEHVLNSQAQNSNVSYAESLNSILDSKANNRARVDSRNLNHSREFSKGEENYNIAPVYMVRQLHQQQANYQDHLEENKFMKLNGLATMMYHQDHYTASEFIAVRDTIRSRYIIKKNHPNVHNDKQMRLYANEAIPVVKRNMDVYGTKVNLNQVVDNPMYQRLMRYTDNFKGGIQNDLQRISKTASSVNQATTEKHNYLQALGKQVNSYSQYTVKNDPSIQHAQQVIHQSNPVRHHMHQVTKAQFDLKISKKDVHMNIIAHKLYPNNPRGIQQINHSIYKYQLAKFHNNPQANRYLFPQSIRVMKTYNQAKQKGLIKDPKDLKIGDVSQHLRQKNGELEDNRALKKIGISLPNIYIDKAKLKAKRGLHTASKAIKDKYNHMIHPDLSYKKNGQHPNQNLQRGQDLQR